jgi:beta-galactosidase
MLDISKKYFSLDGKPLYIYSGEMHYFRIAPEKWKLHLDRAKEAGLNTVSTYIPWSWHEYEEGKFDFTGETHPQRNLAGFLKEVKDSGLYISVRIGPFSNAELKGEGIPLWLMDNYPEIYSVGAGIVNLPHTTLISYINPTFRKFIEKWYDKVVPQIVDYQINNGGNILLTQLCNEIGMIQWVNGMGDYSDQATAMYRDYLKKKYGNINKLNEEYLGDDFKSFEEIQQPAVREKSCGWQDFWDWSDFYKNYFADYYSYLNKLATERGVKTPVIANIPQFIDFDTRGRGFASPMTSAFYKYMPAKVDNVIFGGAYQMRRMDYENFHDVCITTQVVKSLTDYKNPVVCAELQTGIMRDKPRLYATDVELNLKTSMAAGVDGVNCYMFSGGENPDNIGMFGKRHKWQAPVDGDGEIDDKFCALQEYGDFVKTFGEVMASTKPVSQTTLGMYGPYYGTEFLSPTDSAFLVYARDRFLFDGVARLLSLSNISYNAVDLLEKDLDPADVESLWVFAISFMDENIQKKLAKYVKDGGTLILFPELPDRDLAGKECTALIDEMGIKLNNKVAPSTVNFGDQDCFVEGGVSVVDVEGDYETLASVDEGPCSISKKCGKGKFIFIGTPISHTYDYHADIIGDIAYQEAGVRNDIKIFPRDIIGLLRSGDNGSFIFLNNYHQKKYVADIELTVPECNIDLKESNIAVCARTTKILPIDVKLSQSLKIVFSTVEILKINEGEEEIEFTVKGCAGENARIILEVEGKRVEQEHTMEGKTDKVRIKLK